MADDATPILDAARSAPVLSEAQRDLLRSWVDSGHYEAEQDALDHAIELLAEFRAEWARDLVPFLEERLRLAREDFAAGRCFSVDEARADLQARREVRERVG